MRSSSAGRPREFDRDVALRKAAGLFWRHGFSGTSTRALTAELEISSSSLYSAFGTKADLFDEAVRTYALRYSAIYDDALSEPSARAAIQRVLLDSIDEFGRTQDGHPGCLTSSAVMADSSASLNVRTYVAELQSADEARLRARIERAVLEGEFNPSTNASALSGLVQTVWQGLSTRSELGATREELRAEAGLAIALIGSLSCSEPASVPSTVA